MNKHTELIEQLRCCNKMTCNEAADAIEAQAREIADMQAKVATVIQKLDWLATCGDSEMKDGDAARQLACELIGMLGGIKPSEVLG